MLLLRSLWCRLAPMARAQPRRRSCFACSIPGPKADLDWSPENTGLGEVAHLICRGRRSPLHARPTGWEFVTAFDVKTGKQLWKTPSGRTFNEQRGHGPRGTPTVDGARLYALAADGTLLCLNTATGQRVWGMNLVDEFGGRVPTWGISESPLAGPRRPRNRHPADQVRRSSRSRKRQEICSGSRKATRPATRRRCPTR